MSAIRPKLGAAFCISRPAAPGAGRGVRGHTSSRSGASSSCTSVAELRVAEHDVLEHLQALAADHDEAAADRPVRVLVGEDRRPEVVDPRGPEQEALVACAGRVVGERVDQPVDDLERRDQVGRERGEVAQRRPQLLDRRARGAHERPDLVLDDRRRLAQERPRLRPAPGRARGRRAAAPRASGRARRRASVVLPSALWVASASTGSSSQRRAQVRVLVGERGEDGVGAVDELGELVVLAAQLLDEQREVVDDALDVPAPLRRAARRSCACRARSARSGGSCWPARARCRPAPRRRRTAAAAGTCACRRRARRGSRRG